MSVPCSSRKHRVLRDVRRDTKLGLVLCYFYGNPGN